MGKIRDFFFPMTDKPSKDVLEEENESRHRTEKEIQNYQFREGEADLLLRFSDEYEKREDARLHEVESKATVFIGTFSVAVTILMSLLKDFILGSTSGNTSNLLGNAPVWIKIPIPLLLGLAIFYLCFAIINAIKTLKRNNFYLLGVQEILKVGSQSSVILDISDKDNEKMADDYIDHKKAEIARNKMLYVFMNEKVINRKVDYMTLAQDHFMHAVVVLIIMLLLLIAYIIWEKVGNNVVVLWNSISAALSSLIKTVPTGASSGTP